MQSRTLIVLTSAVISISLLSPVAAGAQVPVGGSGSRQQSRDQDTSSSTTSSTTPGSTVTPTSTIPTTAPSTTAPGRTTTSEPGATSTTTTTTQPVESPLATIPPELAADPRAPILFDPGPGDGAEVPVFQPSFDDATNQVLQAKVDELKAQLIEKQNLLGDLGRQLDDVARQGKELQTRFDDLDALSKANIEAAAEATLALRNHTVDAFVNGSTDDRIALVRSGDPVQIGVARAMLDSVVESDSALVERHERAQARLDGHQNELMESMVDLQLDQIGLLKKLTSLLAEVASDGQALRAYENGSQIYVKGFVFPVRGEVEFIDSWGYPRMTGTASAHWHQGTDIFAPKGTPLVATESGVLDRVGVAGLGGMRLWLDGDSGNNYYYAHLVAFAEGMADGVRVNAGDVVGYVGNTGNAKGTPPHLHFEVHPGGGDAVNPYPLLIATYGTRPMVEIVQPSPTTPATTTPLVPPAAQPGGAAPTGDAVPAGGG